MIRLSVTLPRERARPVASRRRDDNRKSGCRLGYSRVDDDQMIRIGLRSERKNDRMARQLDDDPGYAREARISETNAAALKALGRRERLLRSVIVVTVMVPGVRVLCMRMRRDGFFATAKREPTGAANDESKRQQNCEDRLGGRTHTREDKRVPVRFPTVHGEDCAIFAQCCHFAATSLIAIEWL